MDSKQTYDESGSDILIRETEAKFLTRDGVGLFVHTWKPNNPQRVLMCVQGLGGHGEYYSELAKDLAASGTIVVAPDLRGHGRSEGVRGDIDRFDRYIMDIDTVYDWIRTKWPDKALFMLGESMGASIAVQYIVSELYRSHQKSLTGFVLISPVFSSAIRPSFVEIIRFVHSLLFMPTYPTIAVTGREELGCRDLDFNARLRADPLFVRLVSARFLVKLILWLRQSRRKAVQFHLPILVLLGGTDKIADRKDTSTFLRKVPVREQRIVTFPRAYHCLLRDPDTPNVVRVLNEWLISHKGGVSSNLFLPEGGEFKVKYKSE